MTSMPTRNAITLVGLGTVGSCALSIAARILLNLPDAPVNVLHLIDPDTVEVHNIAKSAMYRQADIGRSKVAAARDWLRAVNPALTVVPHVAEVREVGLGPMRQSRAVIIAVDNYQARLDAVTAAWQGGAPVTWLGGLQGGSSHAGRLQRFRAGADRPCPVCSWGAAEFSLRQLSFACARPASNGRGPQTSLTAALRVASLLADELQAELAGTLPDEAVETRVDLAAGSYGVRRLRPTPNPACVCPHAPLDITPIGWEAADRQLGEAFDLADQWLGKAEALWLEQPITTQVVCTAGHCAPAWQRLTSALPPCPMCGQPRSPADSLWCIPRQMGRRSPVTLDRLVPPGAVLTFADCNGRRVHLGLSLPAAWQAPAEAIFCEERVAC